MLVTLPVIPVFLALVAAARERAPASAGRRCAPSRTMCSTCCAACPRSVPTTVPDAQADLVAESGERYRDGTMRVLRLSFLSGAVLDLAATLGTALVAVTVGVRLIGGGLTLRAA